MIYPIKHILVACGIISVWILMFFLLMGKSWLKKFPYEWKNSVLSKALCASLVMGFVITGCTIQANVEQAWRDFDPVVVFHGEWNEIADHAQNPQYIGFDTVYYNFYPMDKTTKIEEENKKDEKQERGISLIKNSNRLICRAQSIDGFSYVYEIEKTEDGKILSKPVDVGIVLKTRGSKISE